MLTTFLEHLPKMTQWEFIGILASVFLGWYLFIFLIGFFIKWPCVASVMDLSPFKSFWLNIRMNLLTALVQTILFLLVGVILHSFIYKSDLPDLGFDVHQVLRHCIGATFLLTVGTLVDGLLLRSALKRMNDEEVEHKNIFWPYLWANICVVVIIYVARQYLFGAGF